MNDRDIVKPLIKNINSDLLSQSDKLAIIDYLIRISTFQTNWINFFYNAIQSHASETKTSADDFIALVECLDQLLESEKIDYTNIFLKLRDILMECIAIHSDVADRIRMRHLFNNKKIEQLSAKQTDANPQSIYFHKNDGSIEDKLSTAMLTAEEEDIEHVKLLPDETYVLDMKSWSELEARQLEQMYKTMKNINDYFTLKNSYPLIYLP